MYTDKDLPTNSDIHNKLKSVKNCSADDLPALRDYLFANVDVLTQIIDQFIVEQEFVEDPELVINKLEMYHYKNAGLLGLAVALERHCFFSTYKDMTVSSLESSSIKGKLTQKDRELLAKGQAADIEGLVETLTHYDRNLWDRINVQRGNLRKSW